MPEPASEKPPEERDLIDAIPGLDRMGSKLQRSFGPSCMISLIITALLLIVLRRFLKFGPLGIAVFSVFVWWCVMVMVMRFGKQKREE